MTGLRRLPGRLDKNSEEFKPVEMRAQAAKMENQAKQMMAMLAQMDPRNKEMKDEVSARMEEINRKMNATIEDMN